MGHYPASLFMGNQSVFLNSGRSRGHIGLGVKFVTPTMLTAELPPIWATVIFCIAHRLCAMAAWPTTTAELSSLDPDMYDIQGHFPSDSGWGSYVFVGGPGAG